jgi:hypothetical protein
MHKTIANLHKTQHKYTYICDNCKNNKKVDMPANMINEINDLDKLQKSNVSKLRRLESFSKSLKLN